jgi:hypothetical protein
VLWQLKLHLQRHKVRLRGLGIESAQADFVLFQPRIHSPGKVSATHKNAVAHPARFYRGTAFWVQ